MVTQSPQGLASLGRYGDSMLVHMNPSEVAGLQSLAMAQGGSLTINPQTGLPEAFSLGGFFKGLLPMFAGMATGGAGMPLWAGIAAGAATGAITSKDKLMGAITGGLGGYGGYNLGQGFAAAATPTTPTTATAGYVNPMTAVNATDVVKQGIANPLSGMNAGLQTQNLYPTNLLNQANAAGFAGSAATGATGIDKSFLGGLNNLGPGVQNVGSGMKNVFTGQPGAWDAFKASFVEPGAKPISDLAAYGKIGMPLGGGVLSGLEPSDIYGEPINMASAKSKEAYDPYATLNLGGSSGLRLVAKGGYIDGYATGGTIQSGGIRDLYGTADDQTKTAPISANGFGLGRLNNLASEQALNQAQTLGYAMGGPISFADGGDSNKLTDDAELIDTNLGLTGLSLSRPNTPMQTTSIEQIKKVADTTAPSDGSIVTEVTMALKNDPNYQPKNPIEAAIVKQLKGDAESTPTQQGLGSLVASRPMAPTYNPSVAMGPTYYAGMNAPKGYADGGDVGMNLDRLPSLNVETGKQIPASAVSGGKQLNPIGQMYYRMMSMGSLKPNISDDKTTQDIFYNPAFKWGTNPETQNFRKLMETGSFAEGGETHLNLDQLPSLNVNTGEQGYGSGTNLIKSAMYGMRPLGKLDDRGFSGKAIYDFLENVASHRGMAKGGYLDGAGDGMSDSIPATIEGKQPARLADGEFVVSADVVSHLGNGSTKAGAKKLYKMMDKVRLARTGTKKQGKQINPDKYLPR